MIDEVAVALRVRHPWESVDLGVVMLRRWARNVAMAAVPIAAAATGATLALPRNRAYLVILALWWLKPLLDRLVVVPAGVLMFSPRSSRGEVSKILVHSLGLGLLADLTWRRLSPWRTYLTPARVFEHTRGKASRARSRDLLGDSRGWIIGIAMLFECLTWAIAISASMEAGAILGAQRFGIGKPYYVVCLGIAYALVLAVVEPLYALSSFSLYLNRRTIAEGWDIELRFKRLRARSQRFAAISLFLLLGLGAGRPGPITAEAGRAPPSFAERVDSILSDPVFGTPRTEKRLALRKSVDEKETVGTPSSAEEGPSPFMRMASQVLRILVAAAIVALAVFAVAASAGKIVSLRSRSRGMRRGRAPPLYEKTDRRAGLSESADRSEALWRRGDRRAAVAAMYQAAIVQSAEFYSWRLGESSTEGDCSREAAKAGAADPVRAAYATAFAEIVAAWSLIAWGGREPTEEHFARMLGTLKKATEGAGR